jgi:hypothetical protein
MENPWNRLWALRIGITLGVLLVAIIPVHADIVTVPVGLSPGDQYRLVFVSTYTTSSASSNIGDYNTLVYNNVYDGEEDDDLSLLGANWKAIASTSTVAARDNTNTNPGSSQDYPIYNLNGQLLADTYASFWDGALDTSVGYDRYGVSAAVSVWTGTTIYGYSDCYGEYGCYSLGDESPITNRVGYSGSSTDQWIYISLVNYTEQRYLYAISSPLEAPVPVPAAIWLLGSGLVALLALRRKGRKV